RQQIVEMIGRQVEVAQFLADRLDTLDELLLAAGQVAQHLGDARIEPAVLALDDEVLVLRLAESLGDGGGPLAGIFEAELHLVVALDLAATDARGGVLLPVVALLLADAAGLVADLLLALLHLVAAATVDRLVADDDAVRPRPAPARPRRAADIHGRRLH